MPAQARIVAGSGTGDGEITVPSAAYTVVRVPVWGVLLVTLTKFCVYGWFVRTTNVALSLPEFSGGTLVVGLTKLARSVPLYVVVVFPSMVVVPVGSACHESELGAIPVVPFNAAFMLPSGPPV